MRVMPLATGGMPISLAISIEDASPFYKLLYIYSISFIFIRIILSLHFISAMASNISAFSMASINSFNVSALNIALLSAVAISMLFIWPRSRSHDINLDCQRGLRTWLILTMSTNNRTTNNLSRA